MTTQQPDALSRFASQVLDAIEDHGDRPTRQRIMLGAVRALEDRRDLPGHGRAKTAIIDAWQDDLERDDDDRDMDIDDID